MDKAHVTLKLEANLKYKILQDSCVHYKGKTLYQIQALRTFTNLHKVIEKGALGGYVESSFLLSHDDNCWLDEGSFALNEAWIMQNAYICGFSIIDGATVFGDARVDNVILRKSVYIGGDTELYGHFELDLPVIITHGIIVKY